MALHEMKKVAKFFLLLALSNILKCKPNTEFMKIYLTLIKAACNSKTEAKGDISKEFHNLRHWNAYIWFAIL